MDRRGLYSTKTLAYLGLILGLWGTVSFTSDLFYPSLNLVFASQDETKSNPGEGIQMPVIEKIDGSKTIILSKNGKTRKGIVGTVIGYGEKVKTNEKCTATVLYPNGSKVVIATDSEFTIEEQVEGVQWNKLQKGMVRGLIKKSPVPLPDPSKPRFLIRTKAAVLGVRGTEFIMGMNPTTGSAEIHTLEGTVDVAKDPVSLLSGKGTPIHEGQFIHGDITGLSTPDSFDKAKFLDSVGQNFSASPLKGNSRGPSSSGSSSASSSSSSSGSATSDPKSGSGDSSPAGSGGTPPPKIQLPQKNPEPTPSSSPTNPPSDHQNKSEDEPSRFKLIAFQAGFFFSELPSGDVVRALTAAWTPTLPVPFISFLSIRGNFGGDFALQGSLNSNFLVYEFQVFLTASLFNFAYVEGGMGEQIWKGSYTYDAGLTTINVGIQTKGLIDRIFIGMQRLNTYPIFNEYKAGIGIAIW